MSLSVALQMDPIEAVSIDADSTFRIGLEAEARGHRLFHYTVDRLIFDEGRVLATGRPVTLRREKGNHVTFGDWAETRGAITIALDHVSVDADAVAVTA